MDTKFLFLHHHHPSPDHHLFYHHYPPPPPPPLHPHHYQEDEVKPVDITEYISPSGEILYPKLLKDEVRKN